MESPIRRYAFIIRREWCAVTAGNRLGAPPRRRHGSRREHHIRAEVYFSVDVEADGPIPGPYSMLSISGPDLMHGHERIWEMPWDDDGRAIFEYGGCVQEGQTHIVWRRIGTHDVFNRP